MRKLGLKPASLSDDELLDLMVEYPTLIRRPLMVENGELVVGFDRAAYARLGQR